MHMQELSDIIESHPNFTPGWNVITHPNNGKEIPTGFENINHGKLAIKVYCLANGEPRYDQPVLFEGPVDKKGNRDTTSGSVTIPYCQTDDSIQIGMVNMYRAAMINPNTGKMGTHSLELPRGYGDIGEKVQDTSLRELEGEMGVNTILNINRLGNQLAGINANSSLFATHIGCYAVETKVEDEGSNTHSKDEPIKNHFFVDYKQLRESIHKGQIYCGLTLAGLMLFDTFLEYNY